MTTKRRPWWHLPLALASTFARWCAKWFLRGLDEIDRRVFGAGRKGPTLAQSRVKHPSLDAALRRNGR